MGWGYGNLGAGGGLNFKVVQYTETPTGTAAENTIAVVTDTAISSWVMSAEQPDGVDGLVWIEVAAESDVAFYADKKQQVKLYPISVSQYTGGVWGKRVALIYQSGMWVQFSNTVLLLYSYGDQCESVTGGYSPTTDKGGTCTFNDDHILLDSISNSVYSSIATAVTVNPIDVSGYSEMAVTLSTRKSGNDKATWSWGVLNQATWNKNNVVASGSIKVTQETTEFTVDLSTITDRTTPYYVFVRSEGYYEQSYGNMRVYKIELR